MMAWFGVVWRAAKKAGGFVLRELEHSGARRTGSGRKDAKSAEKMGRSNERQGAEDAEGRAARSWSAGCAHVGPPIERRGGARLGPFLRTENSGGGVLLGKSGVGFFYFWAEGEGRGDAEGAEEIG